MGCDEIARNLEAVDLRRVAVRDEATVEIIGSPGNSGDRAGQEPPGARFGHRKGPTPAPEQLPDHVRRIVPVGPQDVLPTDPRDDRFLGAPHPRLELLPARRLPEDRDPVFHDLGQIADLDPEFRRGQVLEQPV